MIHGYLRFTTLTLFTFLDVNRSLAENLGYLWRRTKDTDPLYGLGQMNTYNMQEILGSNRWPDVALEYLYSSKQLVFN
jgi:hypothetical protein